MANYPTSAPSFTTKNAGDIIQPAHINDAQDEVVAIGTVLVNSLNVAANAVTSVKFPAVQVPSANVNTLDDYEEGTWTPVLSFGGAAVGITYGTQTGTYTKVGDKVTLEMRIVLTSKGSSTGVAQITGIPFTAALFPTAVLDCAANFAGLTGAPLFTISSVTANLVQTTATGRASIDDTNFSATSDFRVSITYQV